MDHAFLNKNNFILVLNTFELKVISKKGTSYEKFARKNYMVISNYYYT